MWDGVKVILEEVFTSAHHVKGHAVQSVDRDSLFSGRGPQSRLINSSEGAMI